MAMARIGRLPLIGFLMLAAAHRADAAGDPEAGAQVFRTCAACHTLEPGVHRTGPSLAGVFGRKAGTAEGFHRYSEALGSADLVWSEDTLNGFLADPQAFLPGNRMTFRGIDDAQARADLIAYLEAATAEGSTPQESAGQGGMMGSGMAGSDMPDLKAVGPEQQVTAIRYCDDSYYVTTAVGETHPFWEFNLRFKTDSSESGPRPGRAALQPAGMMGDRASVIFADPEEISSFIEKRCR
jgi:cytochrome c